MISLADIRKTLECKSLVREVDQLPTGHVRIETTFRYPDGGSIEVFVLERDRLFPPSIISDLGQTTAWLFDMQIKPWLSKKRQAFVEDVLHIYGVRQNGGALELDFKSLDELESKVVVVAQACLRISDLTFTRRASLQATFNDDLEEVLIDADVEYEPNAELTGRYGVPVRVDYLARGPKQVFSIMGWSSGNSSQAHIVANEIFRKWYDIDIPDRTEHRVTVLDDRYDVYKEEDMKRIKNYSDLIALSDRSTFSDALAA